MKKVTEAQDIRLLEYLDGTLDGSQLAELKKELESSPDVQQRLEELRPVHRMLAHAKLESPSERFVERVMKQLAHVQKPSSLSPRNGLLLAAGIMAAAGILAVMVSTGAFDQVTQLISLKQPSGVEKYVPSLPAFSLSGKMIIQFFLGVSLILTFIVLDRTVLRPMFQRRAGTGF